MNRAATLRIALALCVVAQLGCYRTLSARTASRSGRTTKIHTPPAEPVVSEQIQKAGYEAPAGDSDDLVDLPPLRVAPLRAPNTPSSARGACGVRSADDPYFDWLTRSSASVRPGCATGAG